MARIIRNTLSATGNCRPSYMIVAGLVLLPLAAAGLQQDTDQTRAQSAALENFSQIAVDGDKSLQWQEIRSAHGPALDQRGWDKRYVLDTFDHDGDEAFNQEEHRMLLVSLEVTDPDRSATAVGAGGDAADSHLTDSVPGVVNNPQEDANATLAPGGRALGETRDSERSRAAKPSVYDLSVSDLEGRRVVNAKEQSVGKVKQLVKIRALAS